MSKPATTSPSQPAQMDTSILDSSPEESPRRSWRTSRRAPASESDRPQRSSRRSRYSSASSHFRSLREQAPLPDSPPRRSSTRGRPQAARDRSPLDQSAPSRQVQAPSLLTLPLPPRPMPAPGSTSARPPHAPVPRDLRSKLTARGLPKATSPQPVREPSPQPGTSTGIRHSPFRPYRLLGSSESTLTAPSPPRQSTRRLAPSSSEELFVAPPPPRRSRSPVRAPRPRSPPRRVTTREHAPVRTPPCPATDYTQFLRTPGYSSPEQDTVLDLTRLPRPLLPRASSPSASEAPWDNFTPEPEAPAPAAPPPVQPEAPLAWGHVVDIVYNSGLIDSDSLPRSPEPVQSVIGGPQPTERRRLSLPPSPLVAAALPAAMRSCWGGPWSSSAQHQPPPPTRLYTQALLLGCPSSARGSTPAQVSTCALLGSPPENENGPALLIHQWNTRGSRTWTPSHGPSSPL